jgi:hypothetical protein
MPALVDRRWMLLAPPLLAVASPPLLAQGPGSGAAATAVNVDRGGLALRGYDPVAYFAAGKPMRGLDGLTSTVDGATYRFATAANKAAFDAAPATYLPQYGGFCAWATANGYKADADPTVWSVREGKLYVNYNAAVGRSWKSDEAGLILKADTHWPVVRAQARR